MAWHERRLSKQPSQEGGGASRRPRGIPVFSALWAEEAAGVETLHFSDVERAKEEVDLALHPPSRSGATKQPEYGRSALG